MIGQYYKVIKSLPKVIRPLPSMVEPTVGKILVCCKQDDKQSWFQDVETGLMLTILDNDQVELFVKPIIFDFESLFMERCLEICAKAYSVLGVLPKAAIYVIKDVERGCRERAFNTLLTESDKIRGSLLDKILNEYGIYI